MNLSTKKAAATVAAFALGCLAVGTAPAQAGPTQPTVKHGMGLDVAAARAARTSSTSPARPVRAVNLASVPSSYSLQSYALSPGDQGQVGSCVAWATGYSAYGLLMKEQGIGGAPMAPMYIYSQIARGHDQGTTASVALPMEQSQGIDTKSDYYQGDFDYTTQPTTAEKANAAHYKLSGFTDLTRSGSLKTNVQTAIASGLPVVIGFDVYSSFEYLNSQNYNYTGTGSYLGGHEVTIVGYNSTGVTIENSWGTSWGNGGFFTAPWSFITGPDISEVHSVGKLVIG